MTTATGIATSVSTGITAQATTTATVTWFILFLGQLPCKCLCIHKLSLLKELAYFIIMFIFGLILQIVI